MNEAGIIVGIILGLFGAGLSIYNTIINRRQNREPLRVEPSLGRIYGYGMPGGVQLIVDVINDGAIPLTLSGYGLRLPDHPLDRERNMRLTVYGFAGSEAQFPYTLPARDRTRVWIDLGVLAENLRKDYEQHDEVRIVAYIDDALGRQWTSDRKKPLTIDLDYWARSESDHAEHAD